MKAFFKLVGAFVFCVVTLLVTFYIYTNLLYFTGLSGHAPEDYKMARERIYETLKEEK